MRDKVRIIGGGLSGCEAAFRLLDEGFIVEMHEMRPNRSTQAHRTPMLAELVCSNSLKSEDPETASGLLKAELNVYGCKLLDIARACRVPSGGALAVDREKFSAEIEKALAAYDNFTLIRDEVTSLDDKTPTIIATGPLTSPALCDELIRLTGRDRLYFYDAVAPIVSAESVDMERAFFGGRYGKGGEDYLNLPMNREEYETFFEALVKAETALVHDFDKRELFNGCMPVEEMARRGADTLRFGPLRPVGLKDPVTGEKAYAVAQLRKENVAGDCFNLVGFQTNLTFGEQKRVFGLIPALKRAEFLRYGVMHRNTYVASPGVLQPTFRLTGDAPIYIAGQLSGVEGYVESIASGLIAALSLARELNGKVALIPSANTICGALCRYVSGCAGDFQPMNANFGLLPPVETHDKKLKKGYYYQRAVSDAKIFENEISK